jgi:hypothetical protein
MPTFDTFYNTDMEAEISLPNSKLQKQGKNKQNTNSQGL